MEDVGYVGLNALALYGSQMNALSRLAFDSLWEESSLTAMSTLRTSLQSEGYDVPPMPVFSGDRWGRRVELVHFCDTVLMSDLNVSVNI